MSDLDRRRSVLPSLLISVLFGAAAGAVCTLLVIAYVAPKLEINGTSIQVRDATLLRREAEEVTGRTFEPAGRAAVMLALAKAGDGALGRSYVPGDALAAGVVLTSDGWIVTYGDGALVKAKRPQDLVAVIGTKAYPMQRAVEDGYSGAAFIKIDAANLPVTAFGSTETLEAGETVYARDAAGGLQKLTVLAYDLAPATAPRDLVWSSERQHRTIRVAGGDVIPGAMVLDRKGEVIGIVTDKNAFGAVVVPVSGLSGVIGAVLRNKEPSRPYLGVRYIDLSQLTGRDAGLPSRGALLAASEDGKMAAVQKKSPAEDAGLRAGDVIVALDGAQITAKNPLADALIEYAPGDTVTVTVQRARTAKEEDLDVVLGAFPAP
ncbi:MAG TPA: PDZ domain-containing protein [Candidatus Eisenbacteria bacterium]|jgi:S1-C subfamily serine protease|nr:PDZ domain-containing protein [Candidatus Eisenbacteria bacterium]